MSSIHSTRPVDEESDEFAPKKIIRQVMAAGRYLLSRWKTILLVAVVCSLIGACYSFFKKPDFVAELTFALDEGAAQSSKTTYSALSEELGMAPSLDAGGVFSSMTNIVELMQSRFLIEKTMRTTVNIDGHALVFADFFLDSLGYRDKWMKKNHLYHDRILAVKTNKADSLFENSIFRSIYETVLARNIKIDRKGKGTTIIAVTCVSHNELFSKYFLEALIREVTKYYIDTKTERAQINLSFIEKRTDSIRQAYNAALYGRAAYADEHINPVRLIASVSRDKQQTDIQILRASYIELIKSMDAAKTTLIRDTPLIQYLDVPILPLKVLRSDLVKFSLLFFMLGFFAASAYLLSRRVWRYLMAD